MEEKIFNNMFFLLMGKHLLKRTVKYMNEACVGKTKIQAANWGDQKNTQKVQVDDGVICKMQQDREFYNSMQFLHYSKATSPPRFTQPVLRGLIKGNTCNSFQNVPLTIKTWIKPDESVTLINKYCIQRTWYSDAELHMSNSN